VSTNYAFGPETVEALAAAFHKSWNFISNDVHFATEESLLLQRQLAESAWTTASPRSRNSVC
jgi:hypothetical protein